MKTQDTTQDPINLYQLIHKSIRLSLCEYLLLLGRSDATCAEDRHRLIAEWTGLKRLLDGHALHEDTHVEPLIERADLNVAMTLRMQHTDFDYALAALEKTLLGLENLESPAAQRQALQSLYLDYSAMMADYFRHLIIEETRAMPALIKAFPVEVLRAAHGRIVASIPPQEMLESVSRMARSLSLPELIGVMLGTKASAPPAFVTTALNRIETDAGPGLHEKLKRALQLEAA